MASDLRRIRSVTVAIPKWRINFEVLYPRVRQCPYLFRPQPTVTTVTKAPRHGGR
jgi:hypothetical protein